MPPLQNSDAGNSKRQLLLSIHDVMPDTLDDVEHIVSELADLGYRTVTLLVVPGSGWTADSLQRLAALSRSGAELAGHGWRHVVDDIRGLWHRVHSLLISRNVAEHLALSRSQIRSLVQQCYDWFAANDLPEPQLYVPPAWAMGRIDRSDLDQLPFNQYETLAGIYDAGARSFRRTAMVGFEADTAFRALSCRFWNRLNLRAAGTSKPIRVAIHPRDLHLLLADDLRGFLEQGGQALSYRGIEFHK
jgi:predicted deacetylase